MMPRGGENDRRERERPQEDPRNLRKIRRLEGESCDALFGRLHRRLIDYYGSWTHDAPMVISHERDDELRRLARVLYQACAWYAGHWREYLDLIAYPERVMDLLDYVSEMPFRAGTWRPDVLFAADGRLMVCEITSRFFANGYFLSYFNNAVGAEKAEAAGITDRTDYMEEMLGYFARIWDAPEDGAGDARPEKPERPVKPEQPVKLCILTSTDKSDSIGLYMPFYSALGMEPELITADELIRVSRKAFPEEGTGDSGLLEKILPAGCRIVSALNQRDLLALPQKMLYSLADRGMINDFRTIFLLHDKRFFRLFTEPRFTDACLAQEEAQFLREHTVQTYLYDADREMFEDARKNPKGYILKHHCLGKSEKVYAGCLTGREEWEALFTEENLRQMILQPFIKQKICRTAWKGKVLDDYAVGTMLTVDDRYFGPGLVRTSTRPVINQTDAHKISPVITDQGEKFGRGRYYVL